MVPMKPSADGTCGIPTRVDQQGNGWARSARLAGILVIAALPRIWAAVVDQGIFWPDEIFQSLEPAHRFAFGYGFISWEFQDGARSWLFPGALGLFWKLLALLGVSGAPTLVVSAKLVMAAWALVGVYALMRIGETLGGAEALVLCGVLGAVFPPSIVYGSRCMSEMASGPLCAVAVLLALDRGRCKLVIAGCLAALAIYLRYQNGIITVALLGWLLAQRRRSDALCYAAAVAVTGLAGGFLDLFTWGAPFHSFVTYVRFNLVEGRSADFGVEPLTYYVQVFWSAVGVSSLALAIGLVACVGRATGLLVIVLVYVLAHTLVAHKEFRFMMPIVPLMLALSGVGLAACVGRFLTMPMAGLAAASKHTRRARGRPDKRRRGAGKQSREYDPAPSQVRRAIWVIAALLAAAMGWHTARASFEDFGQRHGPFSGPQPLWHRYEAVNRLLWAAGERPDVCGLGLIGYGPIWTGGYTYFHRDVPVLWATPGEAFARPGLGAVGASANYLLTPVDLPLPEDYTTIETIDEAKLGRRSGPCAAPPDSYTRLFPK
jgi:GPI mannosyltransferase 3